MERGTAQGAKEGKSDARKVGAQRTSVKESTPLRTAERVKETDGPHRVSALPGFSYRRPRALSNRPGARRARSGLRLSAGETLLSRSGAVAGVACSVHASRLHAREEPDCAATLE